MDYIGWGTLIISGVTLCKLFYDSKNSQRQLEIDRRISVIVNERRRMQKDLIENLNLVLNIDKKIRSLSFKRKDLRMAINEISSYKINIWINLNKENKYYNELRSNINKLVEKITELFNDLTEENHDKYTLESAEIIESIWLLIDKYVNQEDGLIEDILEGENNK